MSSNKKQLVLDAMDNKPTSRVPVGFGSIFFPMKFTRIRFGNRSGWTRFLPVSVAI